MKGIAICQDCATHYKTADSVNAFEKITEAAQKHNKVLFKTSCMGKCSEGKISVLKLNALEMNEFQIAELSAETILQILKA